MKQNFTVRHGALDGVEASWLSTVTATPRGWVVAGPPWSAGGVTVRWGPAGAPDATLAVNGLAPGAAASSRTMSPAPLDPPPPDLVATMTATTINTAARAPRIWKLRLRASDGRPAGA